MKADTRSDEELNRIIAEWAKADEAHWKCTGCGEKVPGTHVTYEEHHGVDRCMAPVIWVSEPNYCRDLNACHEAEMRLNREQLVDYCCFRLRYTTGEGMASDYKMICATARQRAEALVKVIESAKEPAQ